MLVGSLFFASAVLVSAQDGKAPSKTISPLSARDTSYEPCASIAALIANTTSLPAQTAFDCLNSVPVDVNGNTKLIDELKVIWQWQSEYGWLKNPPKDWENGPIDINGRLEEIKKNLNNYKSEYQLQVAIQNITTVTGNFHFNYFPDIFNVFVFKRPLSVIALSKDGHSLPKLYVGDDADALRADQSANVSEITTINGHEAFGYLENLAAWEQYIDRDGGINSLLYKGDTGNYGTFYLQAQYDGPDTNLGFANGTSRTFQNTAELADNYESYFEEVTDGKSFFQTFCTGLFTNKDIFLKRSLRESVRPDHIDHRLNKRQLNSTYGPTPEFISSNGAIAGYFLQGNRYSNVAVLKIIGFEDDFSEPDFQATLSKFLAKCRSQTKQKLIIDLRENGGGLTTLLFDTFMQLFPKQEPWSAQHYRATEQFKLVGDAVNEIYNKNLKAYTDYTNETLDDSGLSMFVPAHFRTPQGENFKSWDDFYSPKTFNSDNFTALWRYNYSNADTYLTGDGLFNFTDTSNLTEVFKNVDVVMLTDALCGSACTSLHEELKNIVGVRSITYGGRQRTGPIQAVTGTKGGEVYPLLVYSNFASLVLNASSKLGLATVKSDNSVLLPLANTTQIQTRLLYRATRLQAQDQLRKGDRSGTPLQFIYEAADCRLFYTIDTYADPEKAWQQAFDAFIDDTLCVANSTKHPTSISGGFKPYGPGVVKAEDLPGSGTTGTTNPSASPSPSGKGKPNVAAGVDGSVVLSCLAATLALLLQF